MDNRCVTLSAYAREMSRGSPLDFRASASRHKRLPPGPPRAGPPRVPGLNLSGGVVPLLARAPRPDYAGALVIVLNLPAELAAAQTRLGLTTTQQAKQVGIGVATLTSLVDGTTTNPTRSTIVASLRWLAAHT